MDITGRRIRVEIINGPNLQRIGRREPEIYGTRSMEDWLAEQCTAFSDSLEITYFQSNHEGALIDRLYTLDDEHVDAIILNAGAYSHTSLRAITPPTLEVHISNIYAREELRRHSLISEACVGVIAGFGLDSYRLALASIPTLLQQSK